MPRAPVRAARRRCARLGRAPLWQGSLGSDTQIAICAANELDERGFWCGLCTHASLADPCRVPDCVEPIHCVAVVCLTGLTVATPTAWPGVLVGRGAGMLALHLCQPSVNTAFVVCASLCLPLVYGQCVLAGGLWPERWQRPITACASVRDGRCVQRRTAMCSFMAIQPCTPTSRTVHHGTRHSWRQHLPSPRRL